MKSKVQPLDNLQGGKEWWHYPVETTREQDLIKGNTGLYRHWEGANYTLRQRNELTVGKKNSWQARTMEGNEQSKAQTTHNRTLCQHKTGN